MTIAEDNNTMDIISNSATLMCTPVVSCDEGDVNITWEVLLFNETNSTLLNDTDPSLPVEAEQYGNYTCTVTSANMLPVTLNYQLYGKIFSKLSIRVHKCMIFNQVKTYNMVSECKWRFTKCPNRAHTHTPLLHLDSFLTLSMMNNAMYHILDIKS